MCWNYTIAIASFEKLIRLHKQNKLFSFCPYKQNRSFTSGLKHTAALTPLWPFSKRNAAIPFRRAKMLIPSIRQFSTYQNLIFLRVEKEREKKAPTHSVGGGWADGRLGKRRQAVWATRESTVALPLNVKALPLNHSFTVFIHSYTHQGPVISRRPPRTPGGWWRSEVMESQAKSTSVAWWRLCCDFGGRRGMTWECNGMEISTYMHIFTCICTHTHIHSRPLPFNKWAWSFISYY